MDKIKLTSHIKDIDLKNKMFKIIDKANGCLKNYDVRYSDFLNPFEVENAKAILNSDTNLKYSVDGGYDESERKIVFIYPFYMEYEDINDTLRFIQIEGNFKFKSISHKDYLGSLLSLGIKREKIGDIIIHENFCQVIVSHDICDFILMNLEKVARYYHGVRFEYKKGVDIRNIQKYHSSSNIVKALYDKEPEKFEKRIDKIFSNKQDAYKREIYVHKRLNVADNDNFYNLKNSCENFTGSVNNNRVVALVDNKIVVLNKN